MKRRLLSLTLALLLALSLLPAAALAEMTELEGAWVDGVFTVTYNAPSTQTATLMAASYVNGRMDQLQIKENVRGGDTVTFDKMKETFLVRVFALDPVSCAPLCQSEEVTKEDLVSCVSKDLPAVTTDDSLAAAVSAAVSACASSALALDRYGVYYDKTAAGLPDDSPIDLTKQAASPSVVYGLPRRPDQGGVISPKVSAASVRNLQTAASGFNDLVVPDSSGSSALSPLDVCRQTTKACAVLNAVAESQAEEAQAQAVSLLAAGPTDDQLAWARQISDLYDAKKGSQKLAQLAKDLGCDARRAYHQLVMAQNILQGHYANVEGDLNEFWEKTMIATKAGAKVGLFVCATILTGGATAASPAGYVTLGEAAGIVVGGVDATLEVSTAGAKIILGSDHTVVKKFEEDIKPVSDALLLFGLVTGGGGSVGEKLAFLGDLNQRKQELYDNMKVKYGTNPDEILLDVITMDPNDPTAVLKLLEKYRKGDKTGFEEPDKTVEEVIEDFTEDRPIDDETLEKLLDDAEVEKDLKDVVEDFNEEVDKEIEEEYKEIDDDDPDYPERPPRIVQDFNDKGELYQETCYDSRGERLWARYYNTETKVLSNEAVYSDLPDGARLCTWTRYFNTASDLAEAGGPNRINWIQHTIRGENDVTYETPYYGESLTYNTAGVLVARGTRGCTEVYDDAGHLSVVTYTEKSGTVTTTTTYSYYTYQPTGCKFDPTGHLQEVKVKSTDRSTLPYTEKTLYWETWELYSWAEGDGTAHGYRYSQIIPGGGSELIQESWTSND